MISPILSLLRPHQWIKNAFVAAPLFFTPQLFSRLALIHVILGVACFSAMASAISLFVKPSSTARKISLSREVKEVSDSS